MGVDSGGVKSVNGVGKKKLSGSGWNFGETCQNSPEDILLPNKCYVSPWGWIQEGLTFPGPGNFFCCRFRETFFTGSGKKFFRFPVKCYLGKVGCRFPETFFCCWFPETSNKRRFPGTDSTLCQIVPDNPCNDIILFHSYNHLPVDSQLGFLFCCSVTALCIDLWD